MTQQQYDCGLGLAPFRVVITLVVQPAPGCTQGHRVGDTWIVDGPQLPEDLCVSAWDVLRSTVVAQMQGGPAPFPGDDDDGASYLSCPDFRRRLQFRVRRLDNDAVAAPVGKPKGKRWTRPHAVKITCIEAPQKPCPLGYRVGQEWLVDREVTPAGMCLWAWDCFAWGLHPLSTGAVYPGRPSEMRDTFRRNCPSPGHELVFELKRQYPAQRS